MSVRNFLNSLSRSYCPGEKEEEEEEIKSTHLKLIISMTQYNDNTLIL